MFVRVLVKLWLPVLLGIFVRLPTVACRPVQGSHLLWPQAARKTATIGLAADIAELARQDAVLQRAAMERECKLMAMAELNYTESAAGKLKHRKKVGAPLPSELQTGKLAGPCRVPDVQAVCAVVEACQSSIAAGCRGGRRLRAA